MMRVNRDYPWPHETTLSRRRGASDGVRRRPGLGPILAGGLALTAAAVFWKELPQLKRYLRMERM